jgi:ribose 5-phosphate isomerase B
MKTIYFATDHAGFELKNKLLLYVKDLGYTINDVGAHVYDAGDDYPDYVKIASESVSLNVNESMAVVLGGSGTGEAIVANKHPQIRACAYYGGDLDIVKLSRRHNNANVLSLGARFLTDDQAKEAVKIFLETEFSDEERHVRRVNKIDTVNYQNL